MKIIKKRALAFVLAVLMVLPCLCGCSSSLAALSVSEETNPASDNITETGIRIGVAWRADTDSEFYTNICRAIEEAGGEAVLLEQVIDRDLPYTDGMIAAEGITENDYLTLEYADIVKENTYHNSNAEEIFNNANVNSVIFTGGEDISPTLTAVSADWHHIEEEKDYNATRDVSDYLLMTYCIDKDIPVMGFCRGMQMLAVVSGASMIQDIPAFYTEQGLTYSYEHRNEKASADSYRDYAPHDVSIVSKDSVIYDIFGTDTVKNVPSWHHQAVLSVEGTPLAVTAVADTEGYAIIEAIERTDKSLIMGFQFHPEAAIVKYLEHAENADNFMNYDTAVLVFSYLMESTGLQ